jgi:hypothetical protein
MAATPQPKIKRQDGAAANTRNGRRKDHVPAEVPTAQIPRSRITNPNLASSNLLGVHVRKVTAAL